jgi:hypothetical protein
VTSCSLVDEYQRFGETTASIFRVDDEESHFFRDVDIRLTKLKDLTFQTTLSKKCLWASYFRFVENMKG